MGALKKQRNNSTRYKNDYLRRRTSEGLVFFEALNTLLVVNEQKELPLFPMIPFVAVLSLPRCVGIKRKKGIGLFFSLFNFKAS